MNLLRLLVMAVLVLAAVGSAIAVVHSRHLHRQAFARFSALEQQRDELNIEFDRLQIEIATLADAGRIEQLAGSRLGMRLPEASEIVVVVQP